MWDLCLRDVSAGEHKYRYLGRKPCFGLSVIGVSIVTPSPGPLEWISDQAKGAGGVPQPENQGQRP